MSILQDVQEKILNKRLEFARRNREKIEAHSKDVARIEGKRQQIEREKALKNVELERIRQSIDAAKNPQLSPAEEVLLKEASQRKELTKEKHRAFIEKSKKFLVHGGKNLLKDAKVIERLLEGKPSHARPRSRRRRKRRT